LLGLGIILVPTETEDETRQTIRLSTHLRRLLPDSTVSLFRFMPLPGTALTEIARQEGFIPPARSPEWIKIDPIETAYRPEWIPWCDAKRDRALRYVQEMSRTGIANFPAGGGMRSAIRRRIAASVNRRMERLDFGFFFENVVFEWGRRLSAALRGEEAPRRTTRILGKA
jgi:radical SAM superfamily enzyme YgiQ (UPF0313 family)